MSTPKVSVIIPVYNVEEYLRACLDSVLGQTLQDIEVICVDDGSTDSSYDILMEYAEKDNRIRVFQQQNRYAGVARNKGLEEARGKWVAFIDSDDFYELDGLEKLLHHAETNNVDMVKCSSYLMNMETEEVTTNRHYSHGGVTLKNKVVSFRDDPKTFINIADVAWNGLYNLSFLRYNNIVFNDLRCVNDRSFFIACLTHAERFMIVDDFLTTYRTNMSSSLIGVRHKNFHCQIRSYELVKEIVNQSGIDQSLKQFILQKEYVQVFGWYQKFQSQGINLIDIEDIIADFIKNFDLNDTGAEQLNIIGTRFLRRANIVYQNKPCENPMISIITPVYNAAPYLSEYFESILAQPMQDFEIICIDDGSDDASLEMLLEYEKRDARIQVMQQEHQFAGVARNRGMQVAKGKYILFLDSDDAIEEDYVVNLLEEAEQHDSDIVVTQCISWDGMAKKVVNRNWVADKKLSVENPFSWKETPHYIMNCFDGGPGGKMFKREFIREHDLQFLTIRRSEDFFFVTGAALRAERISILDKPGYLYRRNNVNSSESTKDETPTLFWDAMMTFKEDIQKLPNFEQVYQSYLNNALDRVSYNFRFTKSADAREKVFNVIKDNAETELEISLHSKQYFYSAENYQLVLDILAAENYMEYLNNEYLRVKELSAKRWSELQQLRDWKTQGQAKIKELKEEKVERWNELQNLKKEKADRWQLLQTTREVNDQLKGRVKSLQGQIDLLKESRKEKQEQVSVLNREKADRWNELQAARKEAAGAKNQLTAAQKRIADQAETDKKKSAELSALRREVERLKAQQEKDKQQIRALDAEKGSRWNELQAARKEAAGTKNQLAAAQKRIADQAAAEKKKNEELSALRREVERLKAQQEKDKQQIKKLDAEKADRWNQLQETRKKLESERNEKQQLLASRTYKLARAIGAGPRAISKLKK